MKKVTPILFLLLSFSAFAQKTDSTKKQLGLVVKGDILMPIYSLVNTDHYKIHSFTVEKLFSKRHSLQLTVLSLTQNTKSVKEYNNITNTNQMNFSSLAIIPEYKFFVSKKKNHTGYYVGAFAQYLYDIGKIASTQFIPAGYSFPYYPNTPAVTYYDNTEIIYQRLAIGLMNGIQYYLFNHLVIDCLVGIGPVGTIVQKGSGTPNTYIDPLVPRAAINIGYKF